MIVLLRLRFIDQLIDELRARPLLLPPLVPYYHPNRLLLLPAANLNSTTAAPPAATTAITVQGLEAPKGQSSRASFFEGGGDVTALYA